MHIKEILLCLSFVFMVYYLRRNYGIAAFIITLNLVLLLNLEAPVTPVLLATRALATIGGAGLAVVAGFALLPHWDRKWLPRYLAEAIQTNYEYFLYTFFSANTAANWTRQKRFAETKNSNAYDSFSRYMQEPGGGKKTYGTWYQLITHNVRLTRELNNIHLEEENKSSNKDTTPETQQEKIKDCLYHFNRNIQLIGNFDPDINIKMIEAEGAYQSPISLNQYQSLSLDKMIIELQEMYNDIQKLAEDNTGK